MGKEKKKNKSSSVAALQSDRMGMNIERFKIPSHIIRDFFAIKNGRVLACRR